jgi:hypothetical protein
MTALSVRGRGCGLDYREIVDQFSAEAIYLHFLRSVQTSLMFRGYRGRGVHSLGIKLSGRETDHSPPSGAEANQKRSYTSIHPKLL